VCEGSYTILPSPLNSPLHLLLHSPQCLSFHLTSNELLIPMSNPHIQSLCPNHHLSDQSYRVPLMMFDHAQLRGAVAILVSPGAASSLSLISEDKQMCQVKSLTCTLMFGCLYTEDNHCTVHDSVSVACWDNCCPCVCMSISCHFSLILGSISDIT